MRRTAWLKARPHRPPIMSTLFLLGVLSISACVAPPVVSNVVSDVDPGVDADPTSSTLPVDTPSDLNLLFWTQSQRDASFRMMDEMPDVVQARFTKVGAPRPLPAGAPLALDLDIDQLMRDQRHAALIVLHQGKIRLERYGLGLSAQDRWTSFSVAKSLTSTLVGFALGDGHIESLDDSVAKYIPGLQGSAYETVTVAQLLTMTSGIAWNEDYEDPQADVALFVAQEPQNGHSAIVSYMRKLPRAHPPGTVWHYSTGETNLIGLLVSKATGKNLTEYLSEKIWQPVGMTSAGSWLLDQDGNEVSGCCIQATPRDFAKFGQYILEGGIIDGQPTLPEGWLSAATTTQVSTPYPNTGYGYQWWTVHPSPESTPSSASTGSFRALGIFGQGIFIDREREVVIVTNSNWNSALGLDSGQDQQREAFIQTVLAHIDAEQSSAGSANAR